MVEFQMPAESLKLEHLDLSHSKLTNLHLGNTPNLNMLILEGCKDLVELQLPAKSVKLSSLNLSHLKIRNLPDNICMLMHLKAIKLKSCWHLEKLPEDLGRLECLEELDLTNCIVLRELPNSICRMKSLKYFHLPYCFLVEKLPEEIGSLKRLEELHVEGTGISHLPQSIFQLKRLRIVGFTWQLQSYGFKSVIQTSTYVSFAYTSYHSSTNHLEKLV